MVVAKASALTPLVRRGFLLPEQSGKYLRQSRETNDLRQPYCSVSHTEIK